MERRWPSRLAEAILLREAALGRRPRGAAQRMGAALPPYPIGRVPSRAGLRRGPPGRWDVLGTSQPRTYMLTTGSVMISMVPRDPSSTEILAMVLLSGASTTLTKS